MKRKLNLEALSAAQFEALWDALAQYVDNNNPDECGEDLVPRARFEGAEDLLKECDVFAACAALKKAGAL
jgi:hypothetical protein